MGFNLSTAIFAIFLVLTAIAAQFGSFINLDNAWLVHAAERVVAGDRLHVDVVESNPPLIVYFMTIPVYLGQWLGINPVYAFTVFISTLSLVSMAMAFPRIKNANVNLCIVFILFFYASYNFGEREHLFLIFFLPYLAALWNNEKQSTAYRVASALMAGLAICFKPFYILVWGAVVLTKMVLDKRFFSFWNLENIIIGFILVAYPLYLIFVEKTYVNEVLPLMLKYYSAFNENPKDVLRDCMATFFICQIAFWIVFRRDRQLLTRPIYYCNFACLAAILVVLIQCKTWTNYFLPVYFFGFMTNALLTFEIFKGENVKLLWNKVAIFISSFIMVCMFVMAVVVNIKIGFNIKEEDKKELVSILSAPENAGKLYALNFNLGAAFPEVLYSKSEYVSRYGHFWMLPGIYALKEKHFLYNKPEEKGEDEAKLFKDIMADLNKHQPKLILVENYAYQSPVIGEYKFDFIEYLSLEPEFKQFFSNYEKIAEIKVPKKTDKKEIYRRLDENR